MSRGSQFAGGPLETVRCDLCGASNDETIMNLSDVLMGTTEQIFRLARCRNCDLIYLNPRPHSHQIGGYYPASYAPFARRGWSGVARSWLYRRSVQELWPMLEPPRRVVDIGCGTGELLQAVRIAGNHNLLGIEPSHQAAALARNHYNLDVREGTLESGSLESASVDTVLLSHVLEHLPSPKSTLREIERVLKPGGVAIVWVPNARSLAASWLGRHWMGWDVPRHLYTFTPGTLYRLLRCAGLEYEEISHEWHGLEWAWGVRLWLRSTSAAVIAEPLLSRLHPALAAGFSPLGILGAALGRSGRIRLIARKKRL